MKSTMTFFSPLVMTMGLLVFALPVTAAPPALSTASFVKYKLTLAQCPKKAVDSMTQMNLEIEDHGNGTVAGYGEQSVAVVNCYQAADDKLFVQLAVSSQKETAAETIMHHLVGYLRSSTDEPTSSTPDFRK
jgi:hypothetical protein